MAEKPEFTQIDLSSETPAKKSNRRIVKKSIKKTDSVSMNKNTEKKIKQELKEIYQNDDGSMPDMSDFKSKKNGGFGKAFFTLILACGFLALVAWVGFFVLPQKPNFAENDIALNMSGEAEVLSGELVTYRINYNNNQKTSLNNVTLQVRYPEGFIPESFTREPIEGKKDEWNLGQILGGGTGFVELQGRLYGNQDKEQSFRVFLNYKPENFNSEFQKVVSFNVKTGGSPAGLAVEAPTEAVSGSNFNVKINLKKPANEELKNLAVVIDGGEGFSKASSTPSTDTDKPNQWSFAELKEDQTITFEGSLSAREGQTESELIIKLLGWKDSDKTVEPYTYKTEIVKVKLVKADLDLRLVINGATDKLSVRPGEVLNTTLSLKNSGQTSLKNLSVNLTFDTPSYSNKSMLDWAKIEDRLDGDITGAQLSPELRRGAINWGGTKAVQLKELKAGEEFLIDVSLPIKNSKLVDLTNFESSLITATADLEYLLDGAKKSLTGNQLSITVNSDLALEVRDRVSVNSQDKEVHDVDWILTNSFHELKDIELSAEVFGDYVWDDKSLQVPGGEAKFDATKKTLTWKIPSLPTSIDVMDLKFELTLITKNPTQTNLTSKVKIKATDVSTGNEINLEGEDVLLKSNE